MMTMPPMTPAMTPSEARPNMKSKPMPMMPRTAMRLAKRPENEGADIVDHRFRARAACDCLRVSHDRAGEHRGGERQALPDE